MTLPWRCLKCDGKRFLVYFRRVLYRRRYVVKCAGCGWKWFGKPESVKLVLKKKANDDKVLIHG